MSDLMVPQPRVDTGMSALHREPLPLETEGEESVLTVVLEFVALVRRNLVLVLATTVASLAIALVVIRMHQPNFRAQAVLRFEDKGRALSGSLGGGAAQQFGGPVTDPLLTQIQVLQSRAVARQVVEREGLRLQPRQVRLPAGWLTGTKVAPDVTPGELTLTFAGKGAILRRGDTAVPVRIGEPANLGGIELIVARDPGVERVDLEVLSAEAAVGALLAELRGRARERTDIIDVTYQHPDPATAQRTVNAVAQVFQDHNAATSKQESVRRRRFIEGQLAKTELMLSEAQAAHNRFRMRERVFSSQEKFRSQQAGFMGLEVRREELDADRRMYATLLEALRAPRQEGASGERLAAVVSSPGIAANEVVAQLHAQLSKLQMSRDSLTSGSWGVSREHPDVKRVDALIASTEASIVSAVRGQIAAVEARIAALDELRRRSATEMAALPSTEAEEARLLAQVENFQREAIRLREELQKAQIEEAADVGQIEVLDLAMLPTVPIGTGRTPRLVLALVLGIGLGTLIAFVLENYHAVIRDREELERIALVPTLAVVPPIGTITVPGRWSLSWPHRSRGRDARSFPSTGDLAFMRDSRSHAAEAFRTLRTTLLFSATSHAMKRLVVTSAGPAEGKSTTAANLAVAFAQQGHRVLLLDCDLRRPRIHEVFDHAQAPGLTNALIGDAFAADLVRPTGIEGLSVLPAGTIPPNPAELLGSARARLLLDQLSGAYDLVIIDSPPVHVASDATILGRHADGALLVVRAGHSQPAAVRHAMHQLAALGVRVVGTVLNDPAGEVAKFTNHYGYDYGGYFDSVKVTA